MAKPKKAGTKEDVKNKKILEQYQAEKQAAVKFRQTKLDNWLQNEELYNGVIQNTLITKANLHVPKMFDGVNTAASKLGGMPGINYDTKPEGDENAGDIGKALWDHDVKRNKLRNMGSLSKKEAGIYGRGIFKLIPGNEYNTWVQVDTLSYLISPIATNPKFALFQGEQFIYKTIDQIKEVAKEMEYDMDEVNRLEADMKKDKTNEAPATNTADASQKNLRLSYMGFTNVTELGSKVADLTEWYNVQKGKKMVMTVANDKYILRNIPLKQAGLPRWPYCSYAYFGRLVNFWCISPADILRDPNLALDVTLNQGIDNNTYRNFGMMFVDSASGLKQSSIVPRPLGVTPVTVPQGKGIKDVVWQYTPPEINSAFNTFNMINGIADSAASIGANQTASGNKKSQATQFAASMNLIEQKIADSKDSWNECWEDMAQLSIEAYQMNLTIPRAVKVFGQRDLSLKGITKENLKGVQFITSYISAENVEGNKVLKQKASVDSYNLFKNDPLIPNQMYLRQRTMKEFGISDSEIEKLFDPSENQQQNQMMASLLAGANGGQPAGTPGANPINPNPQSPEINAVKSAAALNRPKK